MRIRNRPNLGLLSREQLEQARRTHYSAIKFAIVFVILLAIYSKMASVWAVLVVLLFIAGSTCSVLDIKDIDIEVKSRLLGSPS